MSKHNMIVISALGIVILGGYFLVKQEPIVKSSAAVSKAFPSEAAVNLAENVRRFNPNTTSQPLDKRTDLMMSRTEGLVDTAPLQDGSYMEDSIALWQSNTPAARRDNDRIEHTEPVRSDPEFLANLQVGQSLDFFIPQSGRSYLSVINSTSNQLGDVKVWKGNIHDENKRSNVIITQGEQMTHVILSTAEGVYSAQIDNKTGDGEVVDEREFTENMSDELEAIPFIYQLGRLPL